LKRKRLTLSVFHNFTVLASEDVANIVDCGWNPTSKMESECESDVEEALVNKLKWKIYQSLC
jgi:hypothetical protein